MTSGCAVLAVAGCAALAVGMARASTDPHAAASSSTPTASPTPRPAYLAADGDQGAPAVPLPTYATPTPTLRSTSRPATAHPTTSAAPTPSSAPPAVPHAVPPSTTPAPHVVAKPRPRPRTGSAVPGLAFYTGNATRVITVVARSTGSTTATLQAWSKTSGGWVHYGSAVTAHVGSDGLTTQPSEFRSATPIGSFTLTQAFGYYPNPGTGLSYFQTTPDDYWISDKSRYYNTHQRCGSCGYNDGTNERLYYETPYYNYAVVINTPSGLSAYPHGSAFFLHVTDGNPTAGCVAISQSKLVSLMRWLTPAAHPRILIGVA